MSYLQGFGDRMAALGQDPVRVQGLMQAIAANLEERRLAFDAANRQTQLVQEARRQATMGYERQGERYGAANEAIFGDEDSVFSRQQAALDAIGGSMEEQQKGMAEAMADAKQGRADQMAAEGASNRVEGESAFDAAMKNARGARAGRDAHRTGLQRAAIEEPQEGMFRMGTNLDDGRYAMGTAARRAGLEANLGDLHRQAGGLRQGLMAGLASVQRPDWNPMTGFMRRAGHHDLRYGSRG